MKKGITYILMLAMMAAMVSGCQADNTANGTQEAGGTSEVSGRAVNGSAADYEFGNSTNLYKDFTNSDTIMEGNSAKEEAAFTQYDLEGRYVQEIALAGGADTLLSVDDSWIYYTAWRKAGNKEQTVICRLPVTKGDGGDVIDTSKEEILLTPEHLSKKEKKLGIKEKDFEFSGACYITSKYLICTMEAVVGSEEEKIEIVRCDLQTNETSYDLYGDGSDYYEEIFSSENVFTSGDTIVFCGEYGVFLLDADSLAVSQLSDAYCGESSHTLLTADGNMLCYPTESYGSYDEEEYDDEELADTGITIYSLEKKCRRTVIPPEKLRCAFCKAEGAEEDTVYHTACDLLGSYGDKIYLRYLFEQERGSSRSAHYGVLSLSLTDWEFTYEKEISEAVQGESVPFHGQWNRYDEQYELTVNLGNPQRVIGNRLFFRSINQKMEQNGWYVYCLDTNKYEKLAAEDYGWDEEDDYLSATEEMLCIDDYDDDDLVKIVWDTPHAEKSAADSGQAVSEKEQLQYIAGHRYDWLREIAGYGSGDTGYTIDSFDELQIGYRLGHANYQYGLNYIVTDLNQNGRLEVIALDQAGSGAFTNIYAYEYSYKTQSLQPVSTSDDRDGKAFPDICNLKKTDVYYDKKQKMHWYFGKDFIHASGDENYDALCLWGIDGKGVYSDSLEAFSEFSYDEKKPVHYYIGDKEVSKEAFEKKGKNMEPNMKKGKAALCWQQDGQALVMMSEEELLEKLTKSWEGFSVKY